MHLCNQNGDSVDVCRDVSITPRKENPIDPAEPGADGGHVWHTWSSQIELIIAGELADYSRKRSLVVLLNLCWNSRCNSWVLLRKINHKNIAPLDGRRGLR